ncbi:MAG: peptidase and matrixin and adamalysin [Gemmatimonadetes bacterium]|nr:peptidase and matrixin and adamalysin [Gemmatimonadota bacterium]
MTRVSGPVLLTALVAALGAARLAAPTLAGARHSRETTSSGTLGSTREFVDGALDSAAFPSDDRRKLDDIRRRLRSGAAGTYIDEILLSRDSSLARWPERRRAPLTVWIQPESGVPSWQTSFVAATREAFENWDTVGLPVHFRFVTDSSLAEVHVTWIDHFEQPISGRTKWSRDDDWWITDANIVLAVRHHQGIALDDDAIHAMALHEIGHLLGLDHTADPGSIMAAKVRVRELSSADRATARLLYTLPPGDVR